MAAKHVRKYAAISFTDIVGFSKMAGKDEALALELLDEHQEVVRPCIAKFDGREVKTIGDAFMVEFAAPRAAVEWAVAVQDGLHARNRAVPAGREVNIRVGIHAGDVVQRGDDLFGDGVNIAARVEPQAPPGGIAVSGAVHDAVAGQVPLAFEAMEARNLKNIDKQIALYRVVLPWEDGKRTAVAAAGAALSIFGDAALPTPEPVDDSPSLLRVALLPLGNASGIPDDAFIPAAIQEDLLGALSCVPDLKVFARDSLIRIKGDARDAARTLKAGLVLSGAAGIAAGRLSLTLECLDAVQGEVLWRQEFTAALGEVSEIYAAIVNRVAETVGVEFPDALKRRVRRRLPGTPQAFLSHLRGWYQFSLGSLDALQRAQGYFKASLQQDSGHALSLVGVAESFTAIGLSGRTPPAQQMIYILPGASEAALQALKQDPFLTEAHAARGRTLTAYTFDFAVAEAHLRRALRGGEGASSTHEWLALALAATGRLEEADEQVRLALERDPLSVSVHCTEALIAYIGGRFEPAAAAAAKALESAPGNWPAELIAGLAQTASGKYGEAEASLNACVAHSDRHPLAVTAQGCVLAASGQRAAAVRLLLELQDSMRSRYVPAIALAVLQLAMGQPDAALENLQRAAEEQNWLAFLHRTPLFDAIRKDPRFVAILEESGVLGEPAAA